MSIELDGGGGRAKSEHYNRRMIDRSNVVTALPSATYLNLYKSELFIYKSICCLLLSYRVLV